jgi:hypothetical protein
VTDRAEPTPSLRVRWLAWLAGLAAVFRPRPPTVEHRVEISFSPCPMTPEARAQIDAEIDEAVRQMDVAFERMEAAFNRAEGRCSGVTRAA